MTPLTVSGESLPTGPGGAQQLQRTLDWLKNLSSRDKSLLVKFGSWKRALQTMEIVSLQFGEARQKIWDSSEGRSESTGLSVLGKPQAEQLQLPFIAEQES